MCRIEFSSTCVDLIVVMDDFEVDALQGDQRADQAEERKGAKRPKIKGSGSCRPTYRLEDTLLVHDLLVFTYDP